MQRYPCHNLHNTLDLLLTLPLAQCLRFTYQQRGFSRDAHIPTWCAKTSADGFGCHISAACLHWIAEKTLKLNVKFP